YPALRLVRRADHCGACAIAEDHRHIPAPGTVVQAHGMRFRTYQQYVPVHATADVRIGNGQAVDEARALGADVERTDLPSLQSKLTLQQDPATRKVVVRTQRGEDDEVDIRRIHAGIGDGPPGRFSPDGRGGLTAAG